MVAPRYGGETETLIRLFLDSDLISTRRADFQIKRSAVEMVPHLWIVDARCQPTPFVPASHRALRTARDVG